jgi:hypothetical protein
MIRLVVPLFPSSDTAYLDGVPSDSRSLALTGIAVEGNEPGAWGVRQLRRVAARGGFPDFAQVHALLAAEAPDGCILLDNDIFSRIFGLAAEALSIPIILFIRSSEELRNLPNRANRRPDLFLLTNAELFPEALQDPRYGSTLLPVDTKNHSPLGIEKILERWAEGKLDPALPDLSVVVPAFREAANVELVASRLVNALAPHPFVWEILIVDDSSPDETYARALEQMWSSPRIRALTKPTPRGMGNAIRYGFKAARAPVIVVTMGDGSDEVDRIPDLYHAVHDSGYALAIGTRYRRKENYATVPMLYRFWSRCFRLVARLVTGLSLSDYTNAFRAFHRDIFKRYGPESGGFEISPEITFKAWLMTHRVTEVDVRHLRRTSGQSKFSFLKAGPGYGKILAKAVVGRLTGRWFTLDW